MKRSVNDIMNVSRNGARIPLKNRKTVESILSKNSIILIIQSWNTTIGPQSGTAAVDMLSELYEPMDYQNRRKYL